MYRAAALVLTAVLASTASAYDFSGNELFIPTIGRTPGGFGTQWQSDLVVTNRSEHFETEISMFYFPQGTEPIQHRLNLSPLQTVTMTDVLLETFGIADTIGALWMGAADERVTLAAHARVYNTGNAAGEFGQSIDALPPEALGTTAWLHGLNGAEGNRVNVGVGNPSNETTFFSISWYEASGELRGSVQVSIGPWQTYRINDIFDFTGLARQPGATVRVFASANPVYVYASVIRNDTGDAYTLLGTGSLD
jgi:hypothetical protein